MTTKHTPGPWIVSPDGDLPDRPYKVGKLMYCVADVGNESDAMLIAKAPDMVEFIEKVAISACLGQRVGNSCFCFSCLAKKMLETIF